jgi:hypothetical protein
MVVADFERGEAGITGSEDPSLRPVEGTGVQIKVR